MKGQRFGWSYPLSHKAIMIANVVEHLVCFEIEDSNGVLRWGTCQQGRARVNLTSIHWRRRSWDAANTLHESRVPYPDISCHTARHYVTSLVVDLHKHIHHPTSVFLQCLNKTGGRQREREKDMIISRASTYIKLSFFAPITQLVYYLWFGGCLLS